MIDLGGRDRQANLILDYLLRVGPITAKEAERIGVWRLAAVIFDLRKRGEPVVSETVAVAKADGTKARIARYTHASWTSTWRRPTEEPRPTVARSNGRLFADEAVTDGH